MARKLLNVTFKALGNGPSVNIGANSSDNLSQSPDYSNYTYSRDMSLGQVGCLIVSKGVANIQQYAIKTVMDDTMGYGNRVAVPHYPTDIGVNMYLNGIAVDPDGNPQPYVRYEVGTATTLHYYTATGVDLGEMVVTSSDPFDCWCGKLYDDGIFNGTRADIRPHTIPVGYSNKYYDWRCVGDQTGDFQLIPEEIIADLREYLPVEPEGFFEDEGGGDFDANSDAIGIPGLPGINVLQTGFVHMYEMSAPEMQRFAQVLWDENLDLIGMMLKTFQDPMQSIINLSMCPVQVPYTTPNSNIIIGNINWGTTANCTGSALATPYKRIDFGTIYLNEFWGNFADYSPHTRISIFLPYCGVQQLAVDDVMNGGLNLWANCDVFTGAIQYFLFSAQTNHRGHGHQSVLYTWSGNMKYNMPFAGSDYNRQVVSSVANVMTAGASGIASAATGQVSGAIGAISTLGNPLNWFQKGHVDRGSGWGGITGALGHQYPYLILERPELGMADNYPHTIGQPNEQTDYLSNYQGAFVKVRGCHIEISTASSEELAELDRLLKEGIIV